MPKPYWLDAALEDTQKVSKMKKTVEQAESEYPILKDMGVQYSFHPKADAGYLEFWPKEEIGTDASPRPTEIPLGQIGVEILDPTTRPIDVMGDVTSHYLVKTDPKMKAYYEQFVGSLQPDQRARLREQYQHARDYERETRPYESWEEQTGMPGYFRGYPFQQWPDPDIYYTDTQRAMLDDMMRDLTTRKGAK